MQKTFLSTDELRHYLNLSREYIYRQVNEGKIKAYRPFGKQLYFDKEEIDAMVRSHPTWSISETQRDANTESI
jgi:excisionase family DNA binding protein